MSALARRIQSPARCRCVFGARVTAATALELGGLPGAIRLLAIRQAQGLERSPAAAAEEATLLQLAITSGRNSKAVRATVEQRSAAAEQRRQKAWQARLEQEQLRRQGTPRIPVSATATAVVQPQPQVSAAPAPAPIPAYTPAAAAAPRPSSYSRKAKGEVGRRLGHKIDKLLAEVRALDLEPAADRPPASEGAPVSTPEPSCQSLTDTSWPSASDRRLPDPEAPAPQLEEAAACSTPMPAVVHSDPPGDRVSSAWARAAAEHPAAAARLTAMAVLREQLLQAPAAGRIELPTAVATELMAALLERARW